MTDNDNDNEVVNLYGVTGIFVDGIGSNPPPMFTALLNVHGGAMTLAEACSARSLMVVPPLTADMKPGDPLAIRLDMDMVEHILAALDEMKVRIEILRNGQIEADKNGTAFLPATACNAAMFEAQGRPH